MMDLNLLNDLQLETLTQLVQNHDNIVVCGHKSPDGDAIGAILGWGEFLKSKGKTYQLIVPDAFPDFLKWMPGNETIIRYDKHKEDVEKALADAQLVFCLDFNNTSRVFNMQEVLDQSPAKKILIDHHENPDIEAELVLSFPTMCSTCELLFRILWQMGEFPAMPKTAAVNLYAGMMTDTGGFTYNSTRPEIYFIIGQLLTKKIDKDKIYRNVYNQLSEYCVRLRGYVMNQKLTVIQGTHASYFTLTKSEMKKYHFIKGDAEGLVNEPLRIKGMRLSISLREDTERPNLIWVSLRSVDQYYCNVLAEKFFNGGGHKNAAGGKLYCSMEEAEQTVHRAILFFAANDGIVKQ